MDEEKEQERDRLVCSGDSEDGIEVEEEEEDEDGLLEEDAGGRDTRSSKVFLD